MQISIHSEIDLIIVVRIYSTPTCCPFGYVYVYKTVCPQGAGNGACN